MPRHAFDNVPYFVLAVSVLILVFGLVGVATARDPGASRSGQGCVMVISCLMVLLALLFGGCSVFVLRQH